LKFKRYLQNIPGYENLHPYSWEEIKTFTSEFLNNSTCLEHTNELLKEFEDIQPEIARLKQTYGLSMDDINQLKLIGQEWTDESDQKEARYQYATLTRRMHSRESLKAEDWSQQADIDCKILENRIAFCEKIWPMVEKLFRDANLFKKAGVDLKDVVFAPPKK